MENLARHGKLDNPVLFPLRFIYLHFLNIIGIVMAPVITLYLGTFYQVTVLGQNVSRGVSHSESSSVKQRAACSHPNFILGSIVTKMKLVMKVSLLELY
jgi:hypothetical protein